MWLRIGLLVLFLVTAGGCSRSNSSGAIPAHGQKERLPPEVTGNPPGPPVKAMPRRP
jgi:hypothetical protein